MEHHLMQFFYYEHLPEHLQEVSRHFCFVAEEMIKILPNNSEKDEALHRLLEAKDCAVRARLFKPASPPLAADEEIE